MKKTMKIFCGLLAALGLLGSSGCGTEKIAVPGASAGEGESWTVGFGCSDIAVPDSSPLYIAGYASDREIEDIRDLMQARAVWIQAGEGKVLLIAVDCIGLAVGTIEKIRASLADFTKETGCDSIHVLSVHTHAGLDTLGLWGKPLRDGKNPDLMENLISAATKAAWDAYADKTDGKISFGFVETENMQRDSRNPIVYDPNIYQLRFAPDGGGGGVRLLFYDAHAESLRGDNLRLSRDFPGVIADIILEKTGDRTVFIPGAIGGLIMTSVQCEEPFDAEENLTITGRRLADYVLSISDEEEVSPSISCKSVRFAAPLDNAVFMYYGFLGALDHPIVRGGNKGATGYSIESVVSALTLGDVTIALIPGEIFPELVSGEALEEGDPESIKSIAESFGRDGDKLLVAGLCNDELGYIVPPSQYLVSEKLPHFERITDETGEDHYEETNSVGKGAAKAISDAFREAMGGM